MGYAGMPWAEQKNKQALPLYLRWQGRGYLCEAKPKDDSCVVSCVYADG